MSVQSLCALFLLGAIWGASFIFMRIAAPEFGVMGLVFIRTFLAALVLSPFVIKAKAWTDIKQHWMAISIVGMINTAIPFALFNYSSLHLQAGVNAILNATAPMFAALIAVIWLKEHLTRFTVIGMCLGFVGVSLISVQKGEMGTIAALPILAALTATFGYGLSASFIRRKLTDCKPMALAFGSQIAASMVLLIPASQTLPAQMPSDIAWLSALALAIFGTGIAYLLYFYLIAKAGPAKAITVGYLVPLFGIIWGVLFLQERLSMQVLLGGGMILLGVMLTTGFWPRKRQELRTNQ